MNEDLAVPGPWPSCTMWCARAINCLPTGPTRSRGVASSVRAMAAVLGFDPLSEKWAAAGGDDARCTPGVLVGHELETRRTAREAKDGDRGRGAIG